MTSKLETYRKQIEDINDQILDLLSKRGELAQKSVRKNANKAL